MISHSPDRSGHLTDEERDFFFQKIITMLQTVGIASGEIFLYSPNDVDEILKNPISKIFPRHGDQFGQSRLGEANIYI